MTTKEKIFEAALNLFSEKGFEGTSVRDITKQAGITVAALYNHFSSKNELMQSIYDYYTSLLVDLETSSPDYDKLLEQFSPIDLMEYLTKSYIDSMKNEKLMKLTKLILMEQYTNKTAGEIAFKDRQRLISSMEELFFTMHRRGLIKSADPMYAGRLIGYIYLGFAADNIYFHYLGNTNTEEIVKRQNEIVNQYMKGLLAT